MRSNRSSALSLPLHCRSGNFGAPTRAIKPGRALLRTRKINGFCASKSRSMRQHASTPAIRPGRALLRTSNRNLDVFSAHQADLSCKFKRNWSFFKKT